MADKNPYLETELRHFMHTFKRQPLKLVRAKGSLVWDEKGRRYYDFFSGLAVCGVGHNHPDVVKAIRRQAGELLHCSNYFYTRPQSDLARELTKRWKGSRVFFCNSGAEANEWAIKLARLWATREGKRGRTIVTFEGSFHGRTMATISASNTAAKGNTPFEPLLEGFRVIPFNDPAALEAAVTDDVIAVMFEPVQGEGGIRPASNAFIQTLKRLRERKNILVLTDEVQSGMGRTGTFFAWQGYGLEPDIATLAKGLAGGLPLGATMAAPKVSSLVAPGLHGSTFGGNPVACAASLEVLKRLSPRALKSIRQTAAYVMGKLAPLSNHPDVQEIRHRGLMMAVELKGPGDAYVDEARRRGLLINCTQTRVLRFLPPYFISRKEIDACISILMDVFGAVAKAKADK